MAVERALELRPAEVVHHSTGRSERLWRLARQNPLGSVSLAFLILISLVALLAPWITPYDPERSITTAALKAPSAAHWFGTDNLGRDVLSRIVYGSRISLLIAISVSILGTVPAIFIGLVSGYCAGNTDLIIQRFVDSLSAFPGLILALLFMVIFGQSVQNVIISLSLVNSPRIIRTIRSVVLSVKERDFIQASRTMGAGGWRIMLRHVLPNCLAPVIILVSASFGAVIIIESSLDFLGLGIPPNVPTWGAMLGGDAQKYVQTAPWMAVFPGLVLTLTVLAMNLLGDTLRDVLESPSANGLSAGEHAAPAAHGEGKDSREQSPRTPVRESSASPSQVVPVTLSASVSGAAEYGVRELVAAKHELPPSPDAADDRSERAELLLSRPATPGGAGALPK